MIKPLQSQVHRAIAIIACVAVLGGCATQRYGRATPLSPQEAALLDCDAIKIEMARNEAFLEGVRDQRSEVSGAHVLGALGDFGIGNVMEGDAAEQSAIERRDQLRAEAARRSCPA